MREVCLIVENGPREAKEPIMLPVLARLRASGIRAIFLRNASAQPEVNTWFRHHFDHRDVVITDLMRPDRAERDVAKALHGDRVLGCYTYLEEVVLSTNALAHRFGVRTIARSADATQLRRKDRMRAALAGYDAVQQPLWFSVPRASGAEGLQQAQAALRDRGEPRSIIKPVEMGSSIGVDVTPEVWSSDSLRMMQVAQEEDFGDEENLREQYDLSHDLIIEAYIERDHPLGEISVEGIVFDGVPYVAAVTEKHVGWFGGRRFGELGHSSNLHVPDHLSARLASAVAAVVQGLGLRCTAFHMEFLLRGGQPVFVEVGARLGGDLIPVLAQAATDRRFIEASIDVALGRDPAPLLTATRNRGASVAFWRSQSELRRLIQLLGDAGDVLEVTRYGEDGGHLIFTTPEQRTCAQVLRTAYHGDSPFAPQQKPELEPCGVDLRIRGSAVHDRQTRTLEDL